MAHMIVLTAEMAEFNPPEFLTIPILILYFVCVGICWWIYHKVFDVVYLSSRGCISEIVGTMFCGFFLTVLVIKLWYVALALILLVLWIGKKKKG